VKIGNTLYIDGGTREEVFTTPLLNEIAAYRQQPGVAPGQHDRAHFLINLDLNVHPQCVVPRIKDIAKRTLQLVLAEGVYGSVFRSLTEMTLDASKRTDVDYRYIPSSFTVGFKSDKFDPALMCRLFCKGFADGKQPWATNLEKMPVEGQACAANDFPGDATPCAGPVPNCP
jgi:hypothetical protein